MLRERFSCLIVFFSHNSLLLLGAWSHAPEASTCPTQNGREGANIVLSPGPLHETLKMAMWKYGSITVADLKVMFPGNQFSGRVTLNKTNYSLTVKELKIADSGDFTFISEGNKGQRPTSCIRLVVQEVLTQHPTLTVINKTKISNESCVVWTECSSKFDKDVRYRWTVNNVDYSGSSLQYHLKPQEGDITFTCTVSNMVSEVSKSRKINCQSSDALNKANSNLPNLIVGLVSAAVLLILLPLIAVCWYKINHNNAENGQGDDPQNATADNQQQLYSSLLHSDVNVYEYMRYSTNYDNVDGETNNYINVPVNMS